MSEERWRSIPGYEGMYDVSDHGRVRSLARKNARGAMRPGRILGTGIDPDGYAIAFLTRDGRQRRYRIHRAMLTAFVRPPQDGEVARHLNDVPADNRLENLAWGYPRDNIQDMLRNGGHKSATRTHCIAGHEMTEENTIVWATQSKVNASTQKVRRICRMCKRARQARLVACPSCDVQMQATNLSPHRRRMHGISPSRPADTRPAFTGAPSGAQRASGVSET